MLNLWIISKPWKNCTCVNFRSDLFNTALDQYVRNLVWPTDNARFQLASGRRYIELGYSSQVFCVTGETHSWILSACCLSILVAFSLFYLSSFSLLGGPCSRSYKSIWPDSRSYWMVFSFCQPLIIWPKKVTYPVHFWEGIDQGAINIFGQIHRLNGWCFLFINHQLFGHKKKPSFYCLYIFLMFVRFECRKCQAVDWKISSQVGLSTIWPSTSIHYFKLNSDETYRLL